MGFENTRRGARGAWKMRLVGFFHGRRRLIKTLLILRHAKSDWDAEYGSDHERPLNRRGVDSAKQVGRLVADRELVPELVISSTAVRARTTAELAIEAGDWQTTLTLDPDLYYSGMEGVLAVVAGVADVSRLMVVGHQPTWGSLVMHLTGVPAEIKTATLAVVGLRISSWDQIGSRSGDLLAVHHPS